MNGDEAAEAYWIKHRLTPEQRAKHFRGELEKLAEKWRIPEDKRRDLRTACDYDHVVAGEIVYGEIRRNAEMEITLRSVEWGKRDTDGEPMCPSCDGYQTTGHEEGCAVAKALRIRATKA